MCGIVGVLGSHQAAPILVEGLKKLEYRGYDSAGIATISDGHLDRRRAMGKLVNLNDLLMHKPLTGTAGIGHTRWATHGAANTNNAHPHQRGQVDCTQRNYREFQTDPRETGRASDQARNRYRYGNRRDAVQLALGSRQIPCRSRN